MTLQFSIAIRNQWLADILAQIGTSAKLCLYTGAPPTNCAASDTGTLLAMISLPATWMGAPLSGVVNMAGSWTGSASLTGIPGYYRIKDMTGVTTGHQGTVSASSGGGDMQIDNLPIVNGQPFTVTQFRITAPGA